MPNATQGGGTYDGQCVNGSGPARKQRAKHISYPGWVYFFRAGNAVKIGYSSNPRSREKSLQTACPEKAFIARLIGGSVETERHYHDRFAEYRLKGEWFDLRGDLAKFLEMHIWPIEFPEPMGKPEPEIIEL